RRRRRGRSAAPRSSSGPTAPSATSCSTSCSRSAGGSSWRSSPGSSDPRAGRREEAPRSIDGHVRRRDMQYLASWPHNSDTKTYSWDALVRDGRSPWDGVRNFMARNNLAAMKVGDRAFLYHSVGPKDVVGVVEVVKEAYPDATADDPRWVCVDV